MAKQFPTSKTKHIGGYITAWCKITWLNKEQCVWPLYRCLHSKVYINETSEVQKPEKHCKKSSHVEIENGLLNWPQEDLHQVVLRHTCAMPLFGILTATLLRKLIWVQPDWLPESIHRPDCSSSTETSSALNPQPVAQTVTRKQRRRKEEAHPKTQSKRGRKKRNKRKGPVRTAWWR